MSRHLHTSGPGSDVTLHAYEGAYHGFGDQASVLLRTDVPNNVSGQGGKPQAAMNWNEHFMGLARYNAWAYARLLAAVADLPDADYRRDMGLFFRSIHGTLNHLLVGEHHLWFVRFAEGTSPRVALDSELESDRARLAARLRAGAARWEPVIAGFALERWAGTLDYTTMRGTSASLPFAATLAHVFNHATHHRGQITAALTALGRPCPELDLVYYLQNPNLP